MTYEPHQPMGYVGGMVRPTDVPSLPVAGEVGGPAFEAVVGGRTVTAGRMVRDPATGLAEPVYDDEPPTAQQTAGMPPITNPVELAQWHDQQESAQLGQFDQQLAAIQAPVQSALTTSYDQYKIDFTAIQNSQMDARQKADRLQQLNASYQKKWIGIKGKTQLEEQAIQQQKQQAAFNLKLQQAMRIKEIQTYAALAENGTLSPEDALRLQYKTLGYDVPITAMRPPKSQSPLETLKDNTDVVRQIDTALNGYRYDPKSNTLLVLKPQYAWKNPDAKQPDPKKDYTAAMPLDRERFLDLRQKRNQLTAINNRLASQYIGRQVPDLASTAAPLAQGIMQARPSTPSPRPQAAVDVSSLSTEELLRIAGGR